MDEKFKPGDFVCKAPRGNPSLNNCGFNVIVVDKHGGFDENEPAAGVTYVEDRQWPPRIAGAGFPFNHTEWQFTKGAALLRAKWAFKLRQRIKLTEQLERVSKEMDSLEYAIDESGCQTRLDDYGIVR